MTTMHRAPAALASRLAPAGSWCCHRCGTDNQARVPDGCPWCADCRSVIALDPGYLIPGYGAARAQQLLDQWVNTRPRSGRGKPRRTVITA